MKKLRLRALSLGAREILSREQLKSITGGCTDSSNCNGGWCDAAVEAVVVAELDLVPADSLLVEIADAKTQVGVLVMAVAPYKLLLPTLNERRVGEKFLGFSCARTLFYSIGI
jgi:hypothetical protein